MDRKQYFEELHIALTREGFTSQPKQGELLPVEWGGLPLCRITADGGVRYWPEDVATPERERACEQVTDLACTVREYMTLLEQAPPLQAQSLTDDYRLLADFNGAVLAAHPTRLGVQFVTWDWSFDHTGLNQGNYWPIRNEWDCRKSKLSGAIKSFVPSPVCGMSFHEKQNGSRFPGCIWL